MPSDGSPGVRRRDFPAAASTKALAALADFDRAAAAYAAVVDSARVLMSDGDIDTAAQILERSATIAVAALTAERRLAPVVEAIGGGSFAGPRTLEISRRITAARERSRECAAAADGVAIMCVTYRDDAERALRAVQPIAADGAAGNHRAHTAYTGGGTQVRLIDRTR